MNVNGRVDSYIANEKVKVDSGGKVEIFLDRDEGENGRWGLYS